ncbi:peptide MFS transporter [Inhella gelatinilytica]|uniref:Peptide MFS transporter n=1 Tax=Inhella gelatinilytica TaxID=2795030 RepID=A0A931IVQ4_9BURK|nr:peptide MFS transporter [Inhella gelatinilytica]MBH9553672.1 peptide MFS transporter [Inhella gelatinilytica]
MSTTTVPVGAQSGDAANETRQPAGIKVLFFAEMWERFSYYGMRALLVLYLVNALGYSRDNALALYGIYTGLVYLTPLIGGAVADRILGKRRAAVIGGTVMMLGHFAMAFEPLLHVALGLLIVGNGFFKPNTTSMVGELYEREDDPRRAGGYSIFYMGINLGAFFSPLVAGTLGEKLGWHWGFGAAGVGMAIGLAQFLWQQKDLGRSGLMPHQEPVGMKDLPQILLWSGGSLLFVVGALQAWRLVGPIYGQLPVIGQILLAVAVIGGAIFWIIKPDAKSEGHEPLTRAEWGRVISIIIVMVFVIAFWTGFEQAGGTMALFADQNTDRMMGSFEVPASWFQSINPLVIVALAPLFAMLWTRLDQSRYRLGDTLKQALGMVVLGLGFVVMAMAQSQADAGAKVGMQWLAIVFFIHTVGELMLSPVGLSMVSRVAPAKVVALMMGVWFLSSAAANTLAGFMEQMLHGSGISLYPFLAAFAIGAGVLLALISRPLEKAMHAK